MDMFLLLLILLSKFKIVLGENAARIHLNISF